MTTTETKVNPTGERTIGDSSAPLPGSEQKKHLSARRIEANRRAAARKMLHTVELSDRLHQTPSGLRRYLRFAAIERIEHLILMLSFFCLALSGLTSQLGKQSAWGQAVGNFFGPDGLSSIHRAAGSLFALLFLVHLMRSLNARFVSSQPGRMRITAGDLADLIGTLAYNLGRAQKRPALGNFAFEQKLWYWCLSLGSVVMIATGLILWFPVQLTSFLPGHAVPLARSMHGLQAVLLLSGLLWHLYHVLRDRNTSIFSGFMGEEEMRRSHPRELRRIQEAAEISSRIGGLRTPQPEPDSSQAPHASPGAD